MAAAVPSTKNQKQATAEQNQDDPSKFYYQFLYKAALVSIFLVILPLFPAQAPEFINQSLLTRNWELLHLIFAGIAISYGLFGRRTDEKEKEINSKFDNAQSFASKFLQVSSFFEDEAESPAEISDENENNVQTWSSQYYRDGPEKVVVAKQQSNFDDPKVTSSRIIQKPLLLPVRSLKSRVYDSDFVQPANESSRSFSVNSSTSESGSRSFSSNSSNTRNAEFEGFVGPQMKDESQKSVVLRSPIPWRSRSGSMESKQEVDTPIQYVSSSPMEESEFNRLESPSLKSQTCHSLLSNSICSQRRELSPSPSFSSESIANNAEAFPKKKSFCKSSPPSPPAPPPMFQKSISMKPRSIFFHEGAELKRSSTSERQDIKWISGDSEIVSRTETKAAETASMKFAEGKKVSFLDKVIVGSDEDTETDDDDDVGGISFSEKDSGGESNENGAGSSLSEEGPDVDKKADEFIAKFREQIRLQRIESIKRRAGVVRNSSS